MARLIVGDKHYVYNPTFTSKSQLVKELGLTVGTVCVIQHVKQDNLPDEEFVVQAWMLEERK